MKIRVLIRAMIVAAALFAQPGLAAQPDEHRQQALELAKLLGAEDMFTIYLKHCTGPKGGYLPKELFRQNPAQFGGISPQSAYWPEVEVIYQKYQQKMCTYMSATEYAQYFADSYAKEMSLEELKAAVAFYHSPLGKKVIASQQAVAQTVQAFMQGKIQEQYRSAYPEVSAALSELARRYRTDPR